VLANQGPTFSGGGVMESQDGGATWTDGMGGRPDINTGTAGNNGPHTDYHALAFDTSATPRLIVGNDGGVWRLDSNDITTPNIAWTDLNTNLNTIQFRGISLDPTNADIAYGGSQDNGTERFNNSLGWTRILGGDGAITRLDPTNNNRLYAENFQLSLKISTNPQAASPTFTSITAGIMVNGGMNPIVNFAAPYVLNSAGNILFGTDFLNLSTNQGGAWTQIGTPGTNNFIPTDGFVDAIAVAPSNNADVYVS